MVISELYMYKERHQQDGGWRGPNGHQPRKKQQKKDFKLKMAQGNSRYK